MIQSKPGSVERRGHIAIFIPNFDGGGAERVMVTVASRLAERGHTVEMVVSSGEGPARASLSPLVKVVDLQVGRVGASVRPLANYLRSHRPDVLLAAMNHANIAAVIATKLSRTGIRVVISERNCLSEEVKASSGIRSKLLPFLASAIYRRASAITAVSKGVAVDLSEVIHCPLEDIHVIYNPTVTDRVLLGAKERPDHPWFADGEVPVVIGVGRLSYQKDFPTLMRAFQRVSTSIPSRLVILGEGPDRPALQELAEELGIADRVWLAGFQTNPFSFIAHSACYVLSSRFEGLPGGLIEALACGTPVVSTDCPSGPDEVLESGKYGILTPIGDVEAISAGIMKVLNGDGIVPPAESWQKFRDVISIDDYERILLP